MAEEPVVFVVDDDEDIRAAMRSLLASVGLRVETFPTAQDFLESRRPDAPACLVLDVQLPGLSGLDLQHELIQRGISIPIVFLSGHGDIPTSVQAIKAGAVEFLTKPVQDHQLLDAIRRAIVADQLERPRRAELADLRRRYGSLTPREREVMTLVVSGLLNKQAAARIGTSEVTVKVHRAHIMRKMRADSVADLVRMTERLAGSYPAPPPVR
jgi:FixJ family two-component response regulator